MSDKNRPFQSASTRSIRFAAILLTSAFAVVMMPPVVSAEPTELQIEVEPVEDPWAVEQGEAPVVEEIVPANPRRPARPQNNDDPLADERTDYLQTVLTVEDNALRDRGSTQLLAIAGLGMAIVAFICICIAVWYLHRRRQRQARLHAKRYAKKLRKALRRSIREEDEGAEPMSIPGTLTGSPLVNDRRPRQIAARQSPVDSQA